MNIIKKYLIVLFVSGFIVYGSGCGGSGGGSGSQDSKTASLDGTYLATLTDIEVVRIVDKHPVSVINLPAKSVEVTVLP